MKTFKFLRILFLAIISLSIISCTNNNEDDDLGSKSPIPDKGYKKLVQMNIKFDDNEEIRCYFNYDNNRLLTSVNYAEYEDGFFYGEETYYIKWDNNIISYSEDGFEWEDVYQISDGKIREGNIYDNYTYDSNGRLLTLYDKDKEKEIVFTWMSGKLIKTKKSSPQSLSTEIIEYAYSEERCEGFIPNIGMFYIGELEFELCAVPWIFGLEQQYLPKKIEKQSSYNSPNYSSSNLYKYEYSYELHTDGYLKTCTEELSHINKSDVSKSTTVYEYFWQ